MDTLSQSILAEVSSRSRTPDERLVDELGPNALMLNIAAAIHKGNTQLRFMFTTEPIRVRARDSPDRTVIKTWVDGRYHYPSKAVVVGDVTLEGRALYERVAERWVTRGPLALIDAGVLSVHAEDDGLVINIAPDAKSQIERM